MRRLTGNSFPSGGVSVSSLTIMKLLSSTLLLIILAVLCNAQHDHGAMYGPAPSFTDLPAPPRMTGIGSATIKVSTRSAAAQQWFDQGLNLMHAFWDMEAYRAFREATRSDASCAMAWWGVYNSLAQNAQEMSQERAEALKKAVDLMSTATDHEQYYIRAIALLAEQGKGRPAWISEMEALINKYPDDVEAKLLLANSLSSSASSYLPDGRPRDGKMYGRAILENLLRTHPDHVAVHHYWIHAVENGPRPSEALPSCEKLVKLAPRAGHLLHMPGHVYYRLGMYEKARASFLASLEFDLKYMRENKIHPINNWNYTHNLDYLVANSAEAGRFQEAVKYAKMLGEIPNDNDRLRSTGLGYMVYGGDTALVRVLMRYGKWDDAIAELERRPPTLGNVSQPARYVAGTLAYVKGMKAVDAGKPDEAEAELKVLQQAAADMAGTRSPNASDWYATYASRVLAVNALDLAGSIASIRGQHEEAVKTLTDAVTRERDLGYWEPPHYIRPVLESLASVYVRAGRYADAAMAYKRILDTRPNSGFAFLGIYRAATKGRDAASANEAKRELLSVWRQADKEVLDLD